MPHSALVREQPLQFRAFVGGPVPHHVVTAVAGPQIVLRAGDRVAEELLARRQTEGHVFEQLAMHGHRKVPFGNESAPGRIARIAGLDLGETLLPDS